jgi:hypothetical protein
MLGSFDIGGVSRFSTFLSCRSPGHVVHFDFQSPGLAVWREPGQNSSPPRLPPVQSRSRIGRRPFLSAPSNTCSGRLSGYNRGHSGIGPTLTGGLLGDFPHVGLVILPLGHVVITTAMGWTTMSEESVTVAAMLPTAPVWSHSTECANDLSMDNRTDGSNLQTLYSFG